MKNFIFKLFFLSIIFVSFRIFGIEKDITVTIKNGTTGKPGIAETLKIIELDGGMKVLAESKNIQGKFTFPKIAVSGQTPLMIQAKFMGVNYNKMVPPSVEFQDKVHEVTVFNSTKDMSSTDIRSLIQIVRTKDEVIVNKVYLFTNTSNPPLSFFNPDNYLEIYVPKSANEIFGQLNQNDSKMGIPLSLNQGKNGRILDRAILPGASELQITYSIPAKNLADIEFDDKMLFEQSKKGLVVFLKPQDIQLKIQGSAELVSIDNGIPKGMKAFKVTYPKINGEVKFQVSGGTPFVPEETKSERVVTNGKIFITWQKSVLGIALISAILILLHSVMTHLEKRQNGVMQNQ
ncbi:MAG: hypothetical protein IT569_06630 [Leptospiraceae bacterium]|nr:hypothetical protein [Leptospiraceae bacterium]